LRMTASLFSTHDNVRWKIYYYPKGNPLRVDISAGDLLWKFTVSLRTPSEMSTDQISRNHDSGLIFECQELLGKYNLPDAKFFSKIQWKKMVKDNRT
jgi:hypothetical protein